MTSDAHQGLKNAIAAVFAGASWQRCRTHFMANLLTRVPKRAQPGVATQDLLACTHHLPATVSRRGPRPIGPSGGTTPGALSPGGRAAGGRRAGHPGLHGLPSGPLAEAVVQQPAGTAEPGDKAPESLPPKGDVVGIFPNRLSARAWWARCWPSNTTNGPKPAATSPSQRRRQRGTAGAQHAGRSSLINIKRDDALLHLLTGHYPRRE